MRVALATPTYFADESYIGGGERYPLNVARGLLAASPRVHVDLIAVGDAPGVRCLQPRLHLHVLAITNAGRSPFDHIASSVVDVLAEADLVHVHQAFTMPSQVAILTSKFLGKPLVVTDHGGMTNTLEDEVGYLDLVDLIVAYSHFGATRVTGGLRQVTVPGGVDDHFFRPPGRRVAREYFLFAGRLLPHKGIDRLLCALPQELPLVVLGRAYDAEYARYIRALSAGRDVRFVETADDLQLRSLYQGAWATILPSVHRDAWGRVYAAPELMGLTPLESMACATPTLVSTAGALPEFVRHGQTGFLCHGLADFAEHATSIAAGAIDADELGRSGRALVESEYSLRIVGERLLREYETVLATA